MPGENIVISMLGDADGNGACGFAVLDARTFEIKGRWENGGPHPQLNYDFWYQPRQNVLASSEFGEPDRLRGRVRPRRRRRRALRQPPALLEPEERRVEQTLELGETGLVPLEIRWLHDPDADEGFVGAALSSTMWHFHRDNGSYAAEKVIAVEGVEQEGWPFPVPGLITDLVVSMDDRFLYFSNWLHGDLRQYDISDPANPRLTGQLQLGGVLGRPSDAGRELNGGPQMLQLSLDGRRLYVTNSLYSTWDNQFYPGLRSWLLRVNCDPGRRDGARPRLLRRLPAGAHARGPPAGRRLHDGDLPMIAHVGGLPLEETLAQLAPAGAAALITAGLLIERARSSVRRLDPRARHDIRNRSGDGRGGHDASSTV